MKAVTNGNFDFKMVVIDISANVRGFVHVVDFDNCQPVTEA